jgi:hypothetical protein
MTNSVGLTCSVGDTTLRFQTGLQSIYRAEQAERLTLNIISSAFSSLRDGK